jgi:hypothetical protein
MNEAYVDMLPPFDAGRSARDGPDGLPRGRAGGRWCDAARKQLASRGGYELLGLAYLERGRLDDAAWYPLDANAVNTP